MTVFVTNAHRAAWAKVAVSAFTKACLTDECDAFADLLSDLMHYADAHGINFTAELGRAERNYLAEVEEEKA